MDQAIAIWLARVGMALELVAFLLAPWQFLDEDAFEHLDVQAMRYLDAVARYGGGAARNFLVILLLVVVWILQPWLDRMGDLGILIVLLYVMMLPLVLFALATSFGRLLERAFRFILRELAESKQLRLRLLGISAALLIFGILLQLIATA